VGQHFIKVCAYCNAVISQCRCPAPEKTKQVGVCTKCWHDRREKEKLAGKRDAA
jgi:tartrate dehydratase alpha subunit/fumarate hydratase class I-like protein